MNDIDTCVNLIMEFLCINLNKSKNDIVKSDLDVLKTFDFGDLYNNQKYNRNVFDCSVNNEDHFDADNTMLVRAILYLCHENDNLPNFSLKNIGSHEIYRGDTLNTFATIFGRECEQSLDRKEDIVMPKFYEFLSEPQKNDIKLSIIEFYKLYHSIGNFIILPNKGYGIFQNNHPSYETINTYRGVNSNWGDFFDKFLEELRKCYDNNSVEKDVHLDCLVNYFNKDYFDKINNIMSFRNLNLLYGYFENEKIKHFSDGKYFSHWYYKTIKNQDARQYIYPKYIDFANKYMNYTKNIISSRSYQIIEKIKSYFK